MFAGKIIAIAFVAMFVPVFPAQWLEKKNLDKLATVFWTIGLIASIYSVVAGIFLLVGWENPLVNADPETLAKVSARARGRGGLIILAIKFWPYVLIGAGGYFGWMYASILWYRR